MNAPQYLYTRIAYSGMNFWTAERKEVRNRMSNAEPGQFAEQCADPYLMNWFVQSMAVFFPRFKQIFIDKRDDDLFAAIDKCKDNKIVVLVNQWHMEGIEHNWAARYGQMPRSIDFPEGINPIGDMDLRDGLF